MQQRILVVLDSSPLGETALPGAATLARATSRALTLLQVILPVEVVYSGAWGISAPTLARYRRRRLWAARDYLNRLAGSLGAEGFVVQIRAVEGNPAGTVLIEAEKDESISAVAIATHYGHGINHPLFGSVSVVEQLIQRATVPLLLPRPDVGMLRWISENGPAYDHRAYRNILVALDGSLRAEQALDQASELAVSTGAMLTLLYAIAPQGSRAYCYSRLQGWSPGDAIASPTFPSGTVVGERGAALMANYLEEKAAQLQKRGLDAQVRIAHGDPAQTVVDHAKLMQADIVVMTTQGSSGPRSLWNSPIASDVARLAASPVLLVPPRLRVKRTNQPRFVEGMAKPTVRAFSDENVVTDERALAAFSGTTMAPQAPVGAGPVHAQVLRPDPGLPKEWASKG